MHEEIEETLLRVNFPWVSPEPGCDRAERPFTPDPQKTRTVRNKQTLHHKQPLGVYLVYSHTHETASETFLFYNCVRYNRNHHIHAHSINITLTLRLGQYFILQWKVILYYYTNSVLQQTKPSVKYIPVWCNTLFKDSTISLGQWCFRKWN